MIKVDLVNNLVILPPPQRSFSKSEVLPAKCLQSTIIMAKAYPNSKFIGFNYHEPPIEVARKRAMEEGLRNHG